MNPINQSEINDILWKACDTFRATIKSRLSLVPGRDENHGSQE